MSIAALVAAVALAPSLVQSPSAAPATAAPPAAKDAARDATPAISLFDGRSLDGWKVFVPEGAAAGLWTAKDGVLSCAGNPIGYIATEKEYESYELTLEWRFDPAKGAGNSGVLLRVRPKDEVWPTSVEAQLESGNAGDIWNIGKVPMKTEASRTEGRHTGKEHPSNEKPLGEWNRYRIVLDGGRLELYVNDLLQNVATDVEVRPGRIALQSEGAAIEFRKIELRPRGSAKSTPAGAAVPAPAGSAPPATKPSAPAAR